MAFYIMRQDTSIEGSAAIDSVPDNWGSFDFIQGKKLNETTDKEILLPLALESGDYRGSIMDGLLTLYHETLKDALDAFGIDNIQYTSVVLKDQETGQKEYRYLLANIIGLIDCVDLDKSDIEHWPSGRGFDFESMVIDESKTNGAKIFRLESDPSKVIINEELKQYFDKTDSLVGVELIQTEDYSDW